MKKRISILKSFLKKGIFPLFEKNNFALTSVERSGIYQFKRTQTSFYHFLEVQFDKYGRSRFRINLGVYPRQGIESINEYATSDKVLFSQLPFEFRFPLKGSFSDSTRKWFRNDRWIWFRKSSQEEFTVSEIEELWPEAEETFIEMEKHIENYFI